jgi:hypothetical protein
MKPMEMNLLRSKRMENEPVEVEITTRACDIKPMNRRIQDEKGET